MSLRRDLGRLLREATKTLRAFRRGLKARQAPALSSDGGKGAEVLGKALESLEKDDVLSRLDTHPPRSYANFGEPGHLTGTIPPKQDPPGDPG